MSPFLKKIGYKHYDDDFYTSEFSSCMSLCQNLQLYNDEIFFKINVH